MNPFCWIMNGHEVQALDAQSRIHRLREFSPAQLRAVIALPDVQKTVRAAAERRLKQLEIVIACGQRKRQPLEFCHVKIEGVPVTLVRRVGHVVGSLHDLITASLKPGTVYHFAGSLYVRKLGSTLPAGRFMLLGDFDDGEFWCAAMQAAHLKKLRDVLPAAAQARDLFTHNSQAREQLAKLLTPTEGNH